MVTRWFGKLNNDRMNSILWKKGRSLYPAPQRWLRQDLVKAQGQISATGRRVRTYRITRSGERHLEREVSLFKRMRKGLLGSGA